MTAEKGKFQLHEFLLYLLQTTARVIEDTSDITKEDFLAPNKRGRQLRDAVVLNLGHMGETANDISIHYPDFVSANPQIPIRQIYQMRNQLFHGYHSINYEVVWTTSTNDVPGFQNQIKSALAALNKSDQKNDDNDDGLGGGP